MFENRHQVGDRFVNGEAFLPILTRPINDPFAYLSNKYEIFLKPRCRIDQMDWYSNKKQSTIKGNLGFINLRGRHPESLENQLAKKVQSQILFDSQYTYENLVNNFTHVVLATGDGAYTNRIQEFSTGLTTTLKGVTVEGEFKPSKVSIWLDYDLAPKGYGYLLPYSDCEANLTLAFPDSYPDTSNLNTPELWNAFLKRAQRDLGQQLRITDEFEISHYMIGQCKYPRIANTFFVGNCFGTIMPAFGFGQLASILTGIYAAHDLCGIGRYEELLKPLRQSYDNSLVLRRFMEKMDNSKLTHLVSFLGTEFAQRIINNENINPFKTFSYLLRPFV